jgi:hypothetical protein
MCIALLICYKCIAQVEHQEATRSNVWRNNVIHASYNTFNTCILASCIYHALLKRSAAKPFAEVDLTTYCRFGAAEALNRETV